MISLCQDLCLALSLPDLDINSTTVVVHRTNDDEEMEALSVRQKRARTPSPHSSSRLPSHEKDASKAISKSKHKSKNTSKISLSRTVIHKSIEPNKKVPKSK